MVAIETTWPAKPKIFTVWSFTKKGYRPWSRMITEFQICTLESPRVFKATNATCRDSVTGMGFSLGIEISINFRDDSTVHLRIADLLDTLPAPCSCTRPSIQYALYLAGLCLQPSGLSAALTKQQSRKGQRWGPPQGSILEVFPLIWICKVWHTHSQ